MANIKDWVKNQMEIIPEFTRTGYKKMEMPQKMHKMILKARQVKNFTYPDCEPNWPLHNCQRITKNGKIGKFQYSKQEYLRSRAYKCLSLSLTSSPVISQIVDLRLSRYSCLYLGSRIHEF